MNSPPMSMNLASTFLIFSLLLFATARAQMIFPVDAYATVSCAKNVDAVVKVFLMEEDDTTADDDLARRVIHLTPQNNERQVRFKNMKAEDNFFDKNVEIYLAFLHNCTGEERVHCTHYREMGAVYNAHNFGRIVLGSEEDPGRKCPTGNWHDRPMPENPSVSVAVNATCSQLTGPVNVRAILRDQDHGMDDTIVKRDFTISPKHRVGSLNIHDVNVYEGIFERHVELYWVFIHTCGGGPLKASCSKIYDVPFLGTFDFPPVTIDSLPTCMQPPSFYDNQIEENRD